MKHKPLKLKADLRFRQHLHPRPKGGRDQSTERDTTPFVTFLAPGNDRESYGRRRALREKFRFGKLLLRTKRQPSP